MKLTLCPACINEFIKFRGIGELGTEPEDLRGREFSCELCNTHRNLNLSTETQKAIELTK